jgi:hypothetical protein
VSSDSAVLCSIAQTVAGTRVTFLEKQRAAAPTHRRVHRRPQGSARRLRRSQPEPSPVGRALFADPWIARLSTTPSLRFQPARSYLASMRCGSDRPTRGTRQPSIHIEPSDSQTGRSASSAANREVQCKPVFQWNSPKSDLLIVRAIAYYRNCRDRPLRRSHAPTPHAPVCSVAKSA